MPAARLGNLWPSFATRLTKRRRALHRRKPERGLWRSAKTRAIRDGVEFSIAVEDIHVPVRCPVLGIPLFPGAGVLHDYSPTLDRIDNAKGYVAGNIAVISYKANRMKSNATVDEITKLADWLREKRASV